MIVRVARGPRLILAVLKDYRFHEGYSFYLSSKIASFCYKFFHINNEGWVVKVFPANHPEKLLVKRREASSTKEHSLQDPLCAHPKQRRQREPSACHAAELHIRGNPSLRQNRYEDIVDHKKEEKIAKEMEYSEAGSTKQLEPLTNYIGKEASIIYYEKYKTLNRTLQKRDLNRYSSNSEFQIESPMISLLEKS